MPSALPWGTKAYGDREHWPDVADENLPGPGRYWRDHTWKAISDRLEKGFELIWTEPRDKYGPHSFTMLWERWDWLRYQGIAQHGYDLSQRHGSSIAFFPGYPIMPGVLLLETMAQASGWLLIALTQFNRMPFLATVKEAKLRSFVTPGSQLCVEAGLVHEGSGFSVTAATIRVDDKLICNCEITFRLVAFPNPQFRAGLEQRAAAIAFPTDVVVHG